MAAPPPWLFCQSPHAPDPTASLGPGEREAIGLALELGAAALLIDERRGRNVAVRRGIVVVGVLGVLGRAAESNLLDLAAAIESLRRTSIRLDENLLREALRIAHARD